MPGGRRAERINEMITMRDLVYQTGWGLQGPMAVCVYLHERGKMIELFRGDAEKITGDEDWLDADVYYIYPEYSPGYEPWAYVVYELDEDSRIFEDIGLLED